MEERKEEDEDVAPSRQKDDGLVCVRVCEISKEVGDSMARDREVSGMEIL
jgi:hypothetical protein